jgi:hypothetical protein
MTEKTARELAAVLSGQPLSQMPSSRTWGVEVDRPDGTLAAIEDHGGWTYRDRQAYEGER